MAVDIPPSQYTGQWALSWYDIPHCGGKTLSSQLRDPVASQLVRVLDGMWTRATPLESNAIFPVVAWPSVIDTLLIAQSKIFPIAQSKSFMFSLFLTLACNFRCLYPLHCHLLPAITAAIRITRCWRGPEPHHLPLITAYARLRI